MPNPNRCKKCGESIDGDGDYCSDCRMNTKDYMPVDFKDFKVGQADGMKDFMKSETIQPPMPWNKD